MRWIDLCSAVSHIWIPSCLANGFRLVRYNSRLWSPFISSTLKSHTLLLCHAGSATCKTGALTADLHQSPAYLVLSSFLLPSLRLPLRHIGFAYIAQDLTVLLLCMRIVGMRYVRRLHEFHHAASAEDVPTWSGEDRFRAIVQAFFAGGTYSR